MTMQYTNKLLEHFKHPKHMGKMEKPDGVGKVGNPVCGDVMYIYIRVKENKLKDVKFETFGCVAAIGSSDALCDIAIGKTLEQAEKITREEVADHVGGLPPIKLHCSVLAADGLRAAIKDYREKKGGKKK